MNFGDWPRGAIRMVAVIWAAAMLALAPQMTIAQESAAPVEAITEAAASDAVATDGAEGDAAAQTPAAIPGYQPLGRDMIKGQPVDGGIDVQEQFSDIGQSAVGLHSALIWVMFAISGFVLILMLWVIIRYRRSANPTPARTTHNTMLEFVWMIVPALILAVIAIPSIRLLSKQYESPPKDAVTVKITGYQWYWGYTYPDNGGFEVISNMMPEDEAKAKGLPGQLAVDNRMVVPVGVPLRIQTTAADVIHSVGVPSLWFKLDAVPGRLNERMLTITEPGIYYGQCSELCGARHGYMPVAVEAVPRAQWEAWVRGQTGGTIAGDKPPISAQESAEQTDSPASLPAAVPGTQAVEASQ